MENNEVGFELKVIGVEEAIQILQGLKGSIKEVGETKEHFVALSYSIAGVTKSTEEAAGAMDLLKIAIAQTGIGLLIIALGALVTYFSQTTAGADQLAGTLGALKEALNPVLEIVYKLGEYISTGLNVAITVLSVTVKEVINYFQTLGNVVNDIIHLNFGKIVDDIKGGANEAANIVKTALDGNDATAKSIELHKKLAEEKRELTMKESEFVAVQAKNQSDIAVLMRMSKDRTLSEHERIEALNKAAEIEKETMKEAIQLAQKSLELKKEELQFLIKGTEAYEKQELAINAANAKVISAQGQLAEKEEQILQRKDNLQKTFDDKRKARAAKELKELQDAQKETERIQEENYLASVKDLEKRAQDRLRHDQELETKALEKRIAASTKNKALHAQLLVELEAMDKSHENQFIELLKDQEAKRKDDADKVQQEALKAQAKALKQQQDDVKAWYDNSLVEISKNEEAHTITKQEAAKARKSIIADYYDTEIALAHGNNLKLAELEKAKNAALLAEDKKLQAAKKKEINDDLKAAKTFADDISQIDSMVTASKKNQLEAQKAQELSVKGLTKAQVDSINKKYAAEEEKEAKEDFERTKALNIAKAVISTSSAIIGFLGEDPTPLGIAESVAAGILGGVQIATISAQQYIPPSSNASPSSGSTYATGGLLNGPSHASGGININAEGGEAIINKNSTAMFKGVLSAINAVGGGTNFAPQESQNIVAASQEQAPIKTYVIAQEVTNAQQAQLRVKRLAKM